jgi:hypothetical protein
MKEFEIKYNNQMHNKLNISPTSDYSDDKQIYKQNISLTSEASYDKNIKKHSDASYDKKIKYCDINEYYNNIEYYDTKIKELDSRLSQVKNNLLCNKKNDDLSSLSYSYFPEINFDLSNPSLQSLTKGIKFVDPSINSHNHTCNTCGYYYLHSTMVTITQQNNVICQHCYFYINYNDPKPINNWTLDKYIELCMADHDSVNCKVFLNTKKCYLCTHKYKNNNDNKTTCKDKISRLYFSEDKLNIDKFNVPKIIKL